MNWVLKLFFVIYLRSNYKIVCNSMQIISNGVHAQIEYTINSSQIINNYQYWYSEESLSLDVSK